MANHPRDIRIEEYTYELPDERIAKYPLAARDASKLLLYKNGVVGEDVYSNIAAYIPAGTLLVFNRTKVMNARLIFKKPTGGQIEVFCLEHSNIYPDVRSAMLQKSRVQWQCMIGGASKWKQDSVLQIVSQKPSFVLSAKVIARLAGSYEIELTWDDPLLSFAEVLHYVGKVPLPPYLHRDAEVADEDRYQTIFAAEEGSVAAPTAGLHFTDNILAGLDKKGVGKAAVILHVGAGTFLPVKSKTLQGHDMHAEWIEIERNTIEKIIDHLDKGVVAVGTTSMRSLESLYWIGNKLFNKMPVDFAGIAVAQWDPYDIKASAAPVDALRSILTYLDAKGLAKLITRTQILIAPGYDTQIVSGLITNFHQPRSTLLLLVAALIGDKWRDVYDHALRNNFRFLSYGDGSLLWRTPA